MRETKSKFLVVKCKCGKEQNIFGSASTVVKCNNCDAILARPSSGKAKIEAKIVKTLE
jgi:small subunit ribosomal protein S27e